MDIQKDLPNTPAEIIEEWLEPVAQMDDYGWPPTEYNAWHYKLEGDSTLAYFSGMQWDKKEMALNPDMIINSDMDSVRDIFKTHVVGVSFSPSISMPEYYDLFCAHRDYLKEHGMFEKPVILEQTDAGLHILDGFYRLCAFFYLYGYLQYENTETQATKLAEYQQVWLGKQSKR